MSNCIDINVDMEDIHWSDDINISEQQSPPINEEELIDADADENDDVDFGVRHVDTDHKSQSPQPLLPNNTKTIKLSYNMMQTLKSENKIVILVDMQFIGIEPVEIAVCNPNYPMILHDAFPVCQLKCGVSHPVNLLTLMSNNAKTNQKTIENNQRYVNMDCCYGYNRSHNFAMKNNSAFFNSLPDDAVYVLRGINKHIYWRNLLEFYKKSGTIYLFCGQFYNPTLDRKNNKRPRGHNTCMYHTDSVSACSLANVYQMADYYSHCKYMFHSYK